MEVIAAQTLEYLPIESIQASQTNPRQRFDDAGLSELSASIAELGIQVPLLVRPIAGGEVDGSVAAFEIVAGERRFRAAKTLALSTVPCIVREMTDEQAREIQIVENLQRADVHPVEEAQAFDDLLKVLGSIAAVAQRLGKEQSYVAKMLRLIALTLPARDSLRAGLITIEHALLLARLAEAEQNAALKWTLDHNAGSKTSIATVVEQRLERRRIEEQDRAKGNHWHRGYVWEPQSVLKLKAFIAGDSGIKLSRAPWLLKEDCILVDGVVPCAECPKNTSANAPLFGELEIGEPTCTDGACFAEKTAGFVRIAARVAAQSIPTGEPMPVRLSWQSSSVKPSIIANENPVTGNGRETANPAKLLKYGQWLDAKPESCTNVRPGITVDWSDAGQRGYMGGSTKLRKPGELLAVCIAVGCKVHRKAWEKEKRAGNQQERYDPEAAKRAQAERDHLEKIERAIRSTLLFAILGKLDVVKAVRMVADHQRDAAEWRKRLLGVIPDLDGEQLEAYTVFCCEFSRYARPSGYQLMQPGGVAEDRKQIFGLAKKVGVDAARVTAKFFHDEGSIAPASDRLYPKGVPWPKGVKGAPVAQKKSPKKAAATPAAKAPKPISKIQPEARKRIAAAMKKRWTAARKATQKKGVA